MIPVNRMGAAAVLVEARHVSPDRAADAPRLALRPPSQHAVVAREKRLGDHPLARDDD